MDARRRLLLDSLKKQYIFVEGSGEIINSTDYSFNYADVEKHITVSAPVAAIVGSDDRRERRYGNFKIQADFTGFKKLCIETESPYISQVSVESAVGYSTTYSGSTTRPRLPDVFEIVPDESGRTVRQFDISNVSGNKYIVGVITSVSSLTAITNGLKIYNIWLE